MSLRPLLALLLLAPLLAACTGDQPDTALDEAVAETPPASDLDTAQTPVGTPAYLSIPRAAATLSPTEGNRAAGRVTFEEVPEGVRILAELTGLEAGPHGFHVHEGSSCEPADTDGDGQPEPAGGAGGHYAPAGSPHGAPEDPAAQRHMGDLGNLDAGSDGTARYERVDSVLTLSGPQSVVGRAVVVHAGADDLTSQPSGDSGSRLACGVIEADSGQ